MVIEAICAGSFMSLYIGEFICPFWVVHFWATFINAEDEKNLSLCSILCLIQSRSLPS